jgi:hypothetical protein
MVLGMGHVKMVGMRRLIVLALILGCSPAKPVPQIQGTAQNEAPPKPKPKASTEQDKVDRLAGEATKLGFRWRIFCTTRYVDEPENFLGDAWREADEQKQGSCNIAGWEELCDHWLEDGKTQGDAAAALYASIQGRPTHPKKGPPEAEKQREIRMCPPEISDQNTHIVAMEH